MTIQTIKKNHAEQELRIVDVSERNRSKSARKSVVVLLAGALAFGLAFAAVAQGVLISSGTSGELPVDDGGIDGLPLNKPPMPEGSDPAGGIKSTRLPV